MIQRVPRWGCGSRRCRGRCEVAASVPLLTRGATEPHHDQTPSVAPRVSKGTLFLAGARYDTRVSSIARDGFDVHYRVYGAGAPVAILAGGPGFDCDYMEPVAAELAKTHQALLIELRGTGRSMPPAINRETINLREALADLESIRADLNLESWTLAGHSFGAILAMEYAIQYPDRVASLILMNSGPICYASAAREMENVTMRLTPDEREALQKTSHSDFGRMLEILLPGYFFDRSKTPAVASQLRPEKYHPETGRLVGFGCYAAGNGSSPGAAQFREAGAGDRRQAGPAGSGDPGGNPRGFQELYSLFVGALWTLFLD